MLCSSIRDCRSRKKSCFVVGFTMRVRLNVYQIWHSSVPNRSLLLEAKASHAEKHPSSSLQPRDWSLGMESLLKAITSRDDTTSLGEAGMAATWYCTFDPVLNLDALGWEHTRVLWQKRSRLGKSGAVGFGRFQRTPCVLMSSWRWTFNPLECSAG